MINATKSEVARLVGMVQRYGFSDTDESSPPNNKNSHEKEIRAKRSVPPWIVGCVALVVGYFVGTARTTTHGSCNINDNTIQSKPAPTCTFCNQQPPTLHDDKSYTIQLPDKTNPGTYNSVVVTPMTFSYDYELYDGQLLFASQERIPNLDYDYAILGQGSIRNVHRDTGEPVSLDEVYLHHFTIRPIGMVGAEGLGRNMDGEPLMMYPPGYALHVIAEESTDFGSTAHLLSNKNLEPIEGSAALAHKHCNECYYGPTKGSHCTPEVSGTFLCCGDSVACRFGGENCFCASATTDKTTTTKYRIEMDFLISRDIQQFERVDFWTFLSTTCSVNMYGESILEDSPPDSYCSEMGSPGSPRSYVPAAALVAGGGALYHHIPEQPNDQPYFKTTKDYLAPIGGTIVYSQSHLHTGGVNATLYLNGNILCTNVAEHGTNPDPATNARNEQNHLVYLSGCYDQIPSEGIRFEKGDVLTSESFYYGGTNDSRFSSEAAAGEHKNVMSFFVMGVVFDRTSSFLAKSRTSLHMYDNFVPAAGYDHTKWSLSSS